MYKFYLTLPVWSHLHTGHRRNSRIWYVLMFFYARSQNCEKRLLVPSCLSVRMELLGSHRTDFHEAWHFKNSEKSVEKIKDIFVNCNWVDTRWQQCGWHPVAAVQYTVTHKQYTEQHNSQLIWEECGPCHVFASYTLEFASFLYNGYRVFPGGKVRPGRVADHSPPSSAAV